MNILVLSWRDPKHPLAGGAEQVMHEHTKGWIAAGHKVTLFASRIKNNPNRREILDDVRIVRKGFQILGVQVAAFFWYLFGKHPNFDLVIDQFHGIPFFTPLYVGKPKLAVLQEVAKEVWFKNDLPFPFNWLIGIIGYLLEPLVFVLYKNVPFMVGSDSAKKDLIKMGIAEKNITIVPHGVIIQIPKPIPQKEKVPTIAFLGALAKDKGIEDALKTFSLLNEKGNFNFWVIGKGGEPYLSFLKAKAKNLGLEKNLIFWGFVSQEKKFELLARAHIMINPSIREGWGLVNLEANSVGTPVVAYKSPGLVDAVRDEQNGVICQDNTPEALVKESIDLVNDPVRYSTLQKGARQWSKRFSWKTSRAMSLDLLSRAVNS